MKIIARIVTFAPIGSLMVLTAQKHDWIEFALVWIVALGVSLYVVSFYRDFARGKLV